MIKRILQGVVKIQAESGSFSRFLTACSYRGISLWGVTYESEKAYFWALRKDLYRMKPLLRKYRMRVRILERKGVPFWLCHMKKQAVFLCGAIFCLLFLSYSSHFIWKIELEGNLHYTDSELTSYLKQWDHRVGMKRTQLEEEQMELLIRSHFPGITWVSISQEGSCLFVKVKEEIKQEVKVEEKDGGKNLVAEEAGIIASIVTRKGVPAVKEGDLVEKGQILISGIVPRFDDAGVLLEEAIVEADGEVTLFQTTAYQNETPLRYGIREITKERKGWGILAFGKRFLGAGKKKKENTIYFELEKALYFPSELQLPISLLEKRELSYVEVEKKRNEEEGILLEEEMLLQYLCKMEKMGVQIIEKNVKIGVNENNSYAEGTISWIRKVGVPQRIEKVEPIGELTD